MKKKRKMLFIVAFFICINVTVLCAAESVKCEEFQREQGLVSSDGKEKETEADNSAEDIENIQPKELDLGDYQTKMTVGETQLLTVTVLPVNTTEQIVTYMSKNTEVATINGMGRITAKSVGTTKITAACGSVKGSFILTVTEEENTEEKSVEVTDIEISDYEKELEVDKTITLTATVVPADATENTVSYRSSDTNIAIVNSSGEVKGIAKGDVIIYCTAGEITKEIPITVKIATEKISVNNNYLVMKPGESFALKTTVTPADASQAITYKSSNTEIAAVSPGGTVTAKSCGSTSIIVSNGDSSISVSVIVNESGNTQQTEEKTDIRGEQTQITFPEEVNASEMSVITSEMLKYFYQQKEILTVHGKGYTVFIHGEDIANYKNEFYTKITFQKEENGIAFELNEGKELCGPVLLSLEQPEGKYLYLYNPSKEKYQMIQCENISEIKLTTGGKYLLADTKISDYKVSKKVIAGAGGFLMALAGIYIGVKKKYWFW